VASKILGSSMIRSSSAAKGLLLIRLRFLKEDMRRFAEH
jgi:hypothetical protein